MKKLILLLALCSPASATIAFTAGTACTTAVTVSSLACSVGAVNAGDLIWIGVSWAGGGCTSTMVVTDGVNPTYSGGTQSQAGATSAKSAIFYVVATTSTTITATATNAAGTCFISVMPGVITGQAASSFVGETLTANSTSATSCTIAFTRTGTQLMTIAGNDNVANANVGWNTTGSTGTFTLGAIVSNGLLNQPGASAFQRVTSGTTVNGVLAVTAAAGGMTCNGVSFNEAAAAPGPHHRVSQ